MINREKRKKRRMQTDEAIHIVALWNLMLILIPFLLLSAAFSETSILNLTVPSSSAAPPADKTPAGEKKEPVELTILADGFRLSHGPLWTRFVPLKTNRYDYDSLFSNLDELKRENPGEENILLDSVAQIPYEVIVKIMDQCREARFPNISLASGPPPGS
jgi:biopolymer transport protein ExbD